jgi:hypothetical protein
VACFKGLRYLLPRYTGIKYGETQPRLDVMCDHLEVDNCDTIKPTWNMIETLLLRTRLYVCTELTI